MCTDFIKEVTIHITKNDLTSLLWEELPNASGQRKAAVATTLCVAYPSNTFLHRHCGANHIHTLYSTAQYIRD